MRISVIITTYNKGHLIEKSLATLFSQRLPEDFELVIIDDGSTDDTIERVKRFPFPIHGKQLKYRYLPYPEPRISCIPRNVGIREATGDIIIFTEPECLHVGDTINELLHKMHRYPNNTILASQVWTTQRLIAEKIQDLTPQEILAHPYAQMSSGDMVNTKAPNNDWAITGDAQCQGGYLFAVRRDWLMEIGGFNERFIGHGFDDLDLFNRLKLRDHEVLGFSDIAVIHQWHDKTFYPYDVVEAMEKNKLMSQKMTDRGKYKVNVAKMWGTA